MNISRLSTFSLAMAIGVFALAFANPASAKGKGLVCELGDPRPKCADEPPAAGLTFKVEMDGAFVMNQFTTSDGNELLGDFDFTIDRPAKNFGCGELPPLPDPDRAACETWGTVFDVCDIYDIHGDDPYGPNHFTTTPDRKEKVQWAVTKSGGGVRVFFVTSIQSPIDPPNPLGVVLILTSKCAYHADQQDDFPNRTLCDHPFLPEGTGNQTTFDMQHFWNHADGKKGVAHAQPCHVGEGELLPSHSTLTITACSDTNPPNPPDCTAPPPE